MSGNSYSDKVLKKAIKLINNDKNRWLLNNKFTTN
jgi:hypothetical protein